MKLTKYVRYTEKKQVYTAKVFLIYINVIATLHVD